jgi:hypothetical protein
MPCCTSGRAGQADSPQLNLHISHADGNWFSALPFRAGDGMVA